MSDPKPVLRVTAVDLENGDTGDQLVGPANYVIIATAPAYVASVQHHGNGTVVLTIKGVSRGMGFAETPIEPGGAA